VVSLANGKCARRHNLEPVRRYGRMATALAMEHAEDNGQFVLTWTERGGPRVENQIDGEGFARARVKDHRFGIRPSNERGRYRARSSSFVLGIRVLSCFLSR
jgi:hypothetical protein